MSRRLVAYSLAGAAMTALWLFLIYLPAERERASLRSAIAQADWQLQDFQRVIRELPAYAETSRELARRKERLNSSLYAKEDILNLFRRIGAEASSHNLRLLDISPPVDELLALNRASPDRDEPQFLNITVGLRGRYLDFGRFVEDLEKAPFFRGENSCWLRGDQTPRPEIDLTISFKALIGSGEEV